MILCSEISNVKIATKGGNLYNSLNRSFPSQLSHSLTSWPAQLLSTCSIRDLDSNLLCLPSQWLVFGGSAWRTRVWGTMLGGSMWVNIAPNWTPSPFFFGLSLWKSPGIQLCNLNPFSTHLQAFTMQLARPIIDRELKAGMSQAPNLTLTPTLIL